MLRVFVILVMLLAGAAQAQQFLVQGGSHGPQRAVDRAMLLTGIPLSYEPLSGESGIMEIDTERAVRWITEVLRRQPEVETAWPQMTGGQPHLMVRLDPQSEAARELMTNQFQFDNPTLAFYQTVIFEELKIPTILHRVDGVRFTVAIDLNEAEDIINDVLVGQVDYINRIMNPLDSYQNGDR